MTRPELAAEVARLRGEGLVYRDIAKRLGISRSYAGELAIDPEGLKVKARKDSYRGVCVDCGAGTHGHDGVKAEPRCLPCAARKRGIETKVWTRDAIIDAIRDWAGEYGEPPAASDWNPTQAREFLHDPERAQRWHDADGRWPHAASVRRAFGSWAAALKAAGFEPRAEHGGGGNQFRRRDVKAAA